MSINRTIKKRFLDTAVYFCGNILSQVVVFFLLPVYTAFLSPESYGYFDIIRTDINLIVGLVYLQLHTIVLRFLFSESKEMALTNSFFLLVISSVLTTGIIILCSQIIRIEFLPIVILYAIMNAAMNYFSCVARGEGHNTLFAVSGFLATVINVVLNIIFIVVLKIGYQSLYYASILSNLAQCIIIIAWVHFFKNISIQSFNKHVIIQMLQFGIPFAVNSSGYWFLSGYSKTVIANNLGMYYNGIYAIVIKFNTILSLVSTCLLMVWQEISFKKYEDIKNDPQEISRYYSKSNRVVFPGLLICAAIILPGIRIIYPILINESYSEGLYQIPLAIVGMALNVYCSYLTSIFTAIKKNKSMMIATFLGAAANIIFANSLINKFQITGINIALIIGFFINTIIRLLFLKKIIGLHFKIRLIFLPCLLVAVAIFIYQYTTIYINALFFLTTIVFLSLFFFKNQNTRSLIFE